MRWMFGLAFLLGSSTLASAACGESLGPAATTIKKVVADIDGTEEGVCVFYGDYSGDGRDDALLFVYSSDPDGGNMVMLDVFKFRSAKTGFQPDGQVGDVYGESPRRVDFSKGRIRVTTTIQGPNDPRCCPTVEKRWTIRAR